MKQTMKKNVWLVAFLAIGSIQAFAKPFAVGPYLRQTPPGSTAQVFAPGLICNTGQGQWESHGTFSADGKTFCFMRGRGIFITENTNQGWTTPKRIKSVPEIPWSPYLSPDANSFYFMYSYDLYRCNRMARGWAKPQKLGPPLSSPSKELTCSLAANNSIYLGSHRKGGRGDMDIWYARCVDNTWPRAINIPSMNTSLGECHPGIAPDESFLVFNSPRAGGLGGADLYLILRRPDGTWAEARNLGPRINTAYHDFGAYISPDKKYLFFTRSNGWDPRIHTADIYWVELKEYLPESYR